MAKFTIGIYSILLLIFSCSSESSPTSGISTNPNFMKGSIKLADKTPVAGALVALADFKGHRRSGLSAESSFSVL